MKNTIQIFATVGLFLGATLNTLAQSPDWNTSGNEIDGTDWFGADTDSDIPVQFRHEADISNSYFEWFTTDGTTQPRMRLTRDGWLGLGTTNPGEQFHIHTPGDFISGRITKDVNPLGLHWGLMDATQFDGVGFIGSFDDDSQFRIFAHAQEAARFTQEAYTGQDPDNDGPVNRLLLRYNSESGVNLYEPYSMITMGRNWDAAEQDGLERDWMNVGTTCLFNADILYTGLIEYEDAVTDAVTVWGCQEGGEHGPDNYRFLFITGTAGTGDAAEDEGRETMRITPLGNVGIGDFSSMTNGLDEQPTQKLDVDGTVRLRQMPNNEPDVVITGVEADATGDYVLNYSTMEDFIGEIDIPCDWDIVSGGADVATGYSGACVEGEVLIGTDDQIGSNAKVFMTKDYAGTTLRVEATEGSAVEEIAGEFIANQAQMNIGLRGTTSNANNTNIGVDGAARTSEGQNFGVRGTALDARVNYGVAGTANVASSLNFGVHGRAFGSTVEPLTNNNVGVYGEARNESNNYNFGGYFRACDANRNIGVYADVCDPLSTSDFAAYFVGQTFTTFTPINLSDESVKTDIESIGGALDIIEQLNPIQYHFATEQFPHIGMTDDLTFGFSAQEVQQILPTVVEEVVHPAKYDTLGEEISPSEELLGIQYQEFIAILTAGIKEQQAQIDEQAQTIDDLQESLNNQNDLIAQMMDQMDALADQVNDCCEGGLKFNPMEDGHGGLNDKPSLNGNVLEQNVPNPFRSQTNISYTLEQGGKVLLNIFDKTGKPITTLVEAEQQAGNYRYEWDASGLPAGLYHYALYVDGELLVKKAIKLQD